MRLKLLAVAIFVITFFSSIFFPLVADTNLDFEVQKFNLGKDGKFTEDKKSSVQNIHVHLGKSYFTVDDGQEKTAYDFDRRQIVKIDNANKTYRKYSLFSLIGFRVAEIQNRNSIKKLLKENSSNYYLNPVLSKHKFSVSLGENSVQIQSKENGDKRIFKAGEWVLAEIGNKGKAIASDDVPVFLKFLRYYSGGHPEILEAIRKTSIIPEKFSLNFYDEEVTRFNYGLKRLEQASEVAYSLEGLRDESSEPQDDFWNYLSRISREDKEKSVQRMASVQVDIQESLDHQKYLEAILGCMESGLYNSHFDIEICQKNIGSIQKDPDVKTFFKNLNTNENVTPAEAYLQLKAMESSAGEKVYVLRIFEANLLARTGKTNEAFSMVFESLKKNPYITGAYKDLGELFYNNYYTDLAWLCWDTGRKIYPEHSMLKEIDKLEEDLVKQYPEYF